MEFQPTLNHMGDTGSWEPLDFICVTEVSIISLYYIILYSHGHIQLYFTHAHFFFRLLNRHNHDLISNGKLTLRRIKLCKNQIQSNFNSSSKQNVKNGSKWIVRLSGLCGCVTIAVKKCQVAECKTKVLKSRLDHLSDEEEKTDSKFDWSGFFKLLVPELGYLLAAIIVSFTCMKNVCLNQVVHCHHVARCTTLGHYIFW